MVEERKFKVLWVAPYPMEFILDLPKLPAHSAPWITELADRLKDKVDLTVCVLNWKADKDQFIVKNGIRFWILKTPNPILDLATFFRLRIRKLRKWYENLSGESFDVIHLQGTEHQYASSFNFARPPKVISIQGLLFECIKFPPALIRTRLIWNLGAWYEKNEIRRNHNFVGRTHWDHNRLRSLQSNATIFENWEILRSDFHADLYDYDSNQILFIGGLNKLKGIFESIKALKFLVDHQANFRLKICGNGSPEKLDVMLSNLGADNLRKHIQFVGLQTGEQLAALFEESFCLWHPSYIDNSPNSVCEAQVAGLPVIASNVGGVSSLIKDQVTGLLVERMQYRELAEAVIRLKNDSELYQEISQRSRAEARPRHDPARIAGRTLEIYKKVVTDAC